MTFRPMPGLSIAALIALAILLSLGTWQLQRLAWKQDLISRMQERAQSAPVSLGEALDASKQGEDTAFLPVRITGRFQHDRELHLFTVENGRMGRRIITPLTTKSGLHVLVDRGFVPDDLRPQDKRKQGLSETSITLEGQVRHTGTAGLFVPDNDPPDNEWYWRDHAGMAAAAGLYGKDTLVPFFIEAASPAPGGWPNGRASRPKLINNHLEYALTWYSLAIVMIVIYLALHARAGRLSLRDKETG